MHFLSTNGLGLSTCALFTRTVTHIERKLYGKFKCLTLAPPSWMMRGHETLSFDKELKDTGVTSWESRKGPGDHGYVLKYLNAIFVFKEGV